MEGQGGASSEDDDLDQVLREATHSESGDGAAALFGFETEDEAAPAPVAAPLRDVEAEAACASSKLRSPLLQLQPRCATSKLRSPCPHAADYYLKVARADTVMEKIGCCSAASCT